VPDLFEKAEKARAHSQFETARKTYQALLRSSLDKEEKAEALLGLADVERIRGYFPEALKHYRQAGQLFKTIDPTAQLDAQVGWALSARASGQPWPALKELSKALIQYRKHKDQQGEAFTRWALGGTWRIAGDMKKGLKELLLARALYKKIKDAEGYSYVCCALGGIYRMLGQYDLSGRYYREANQRMRQRKDTFGIAYSYCGLGNVQRMAGRFKQALPFYQKAEKLYGTIGDRVSYAYTLWSIGTTYKMLGRYEDAAKFFFKADKLFIETGDTRGRIYIRQGLGEVRTLLPLDSKIKAVIVAYDNDKKNQISTKGFVWENLHEQFLISYLLHEITKQLYGYSKNKENDGILKKGNFYISKKIKLLYKKAGSKFYPKSIPVNWP
jgi:tetratricopeptide (TPR) repeat protein